MNTLQLNDLASLARDLGSGALSLFDYLQQLEETFTVKEPNLFAFLPENKRFERLHHEAEHLLSTFSDLNKRPPLFGVPIGVKDIFHAIGYTTRAGTTLPLRELQGPEALSVTKLKDAGALILGKTVTTEFAYFPPGPTRNPYNPGHTPGGSSSGSAAAVAASLCPLALGSQTIGSIMRPASYCGVIGFKPSYERISREGVIPLSPSVDHIGFFVTTLAGARLAARILCNYWNDEHSQHTPVLGIPEGPYLSYTSEEGISFFRRKTQQLKEYGFDVVSINVMSDFKEIAAQHNQIVSAEAAQVHKHWFSKYKDMYHDKTRELIERGQTISSQILMKALEGRKRLRDELTDCMDDNNIDLWLSPAAQGPAPRGLDYTGDPIMNLPWTYSGLPVISLPAGFNKEGMPMGLQITARWYHDEVLLALSTGIMDCLKATST